MPLSSARLAFDQAIADLPPFEVDVFQKRYPKGHPKGGQFRPKNGGDPSPTSDAPEAKVSRLGKAKAELVELSQPGDRTSDEPQNLEQFEDELLDQLAEVLAEGDEQIAIVEVEFKDESFIGIYQSGETKHRFQLTEKDGNWEKQIEDL